MKRSAKLANRYTATEQMVVCGAREIIDGDVVYVGIGLPMLATWLAKYSHAPECVVVHEVGIIRTSPCPLGYALDSLPVQTYADMLTNFFQVNSLASNGYFTKGFIGAGQVDRHGNVNSTVIGDYKNPLHRWPGSGGANDVASLCKNLIIILHQKLQRFPQKVDFITSPGYLDGIPGQREKEGLLPGTGPKKVITNLGVYGFENGEMVLESIHFDLGITLEDIKGQLDWDIKISAQLRQTEPPNDEYLRILREEVDPQGLYVDGKPVVR